MPKIDPAQLSKRYYSIGEVAEMFGLSTSLVRFWENEFDEIKPHKNSKGDRRFTPENILQIELVYHLVKERGFTLNGAKQEILRLKALEKKRKKALKELAELRDFLVQMKVQLSKGADRNPD